MGRVLSSIQVAGMVSNTLEFLTGPRFYYWKKKAESRLIEGNFVLSKVIKRSCQRRNRVTAFFAKGTGVILFQRPDFPLKIRVNFL